jgi:hypothetical protein
MGVEHVWSFAALEHDELLASGAESAVAGEVHQKVLERLLLEV